MLCTSSIQPGGYVFYKTSDLQFFRIVSDSLEKYYPGSKHVAALKAYTENMIAKYKSQLLLRSAAKDNFPSGNQAAGYGRRYGKSY